MAGSLAIPGSRLSVTGPIFGIRALAVALRRVGMLGDGFIDSGSKPVFTIALPCTPFVRIARTWIGETAKPSLIAFAVGALPGSIPGTTPTITILRRLQLM